jgi:ATP-dependent helicase HrpB
LVLAADELGITRWGCDAAALLSERRIRRGRLPSAVVLDPRAHAADILADIDALEAARRGRGGGDLDSGAVRWVERSAQQLWKLVGGRAERRSDARDPTAALCRALLAAFPDRVARVIPGERNPRLAVVGGSTAVLSERSVTKQAKLVVAIGIESRKGGTHSGQAVVESAATIEPEWLLEHFEERLDEQTRAIFNPENERVEAVTELRYEGLVLERTKARDVPADAGEILAQAALARGIRTFVADKDALAELEHRTRFAAQFERQIPILDESAVSQVLMESCTSCTSFTELRRTDLVGRALARLDRAVRAALERIAPVRIDIGTRRGLRVHYAADRPPWVESRLQDFFGVTQVPTIAGGQCPLTVQLLAPNGRPVQVTTDLAGFWQRHYPQLRRSLMRRYPKHAWPEEPLSPAKNTGERVKKPK